MAHPLLNLRVMAMSLRAEGVFEFDLRDQSGDALPPFTAGCHIDLHVEGGLVRSYSLCNDPRESHRYVIAVGLDPASRGGSRYLHEKLRVGAMIDVEAPRNTFALNEDASHSLLVAGGIGITPLWCMAQRLTQLGRGWEMLYAARSRRNAAYLAEIQQLAAESGNRLRLHFSDEAGGRADLRAALGSLSPDTHAYCCGPASMIETFRESAGERLGAANIHVEFFKAAAPPDLSGGSFVINLDRSKRRLEVAADKSILDTLLDAGIEVPHSCMEGICGSCQVKVLSGTPDHRDSVLSDREKAANTVVMACCSRSKSHTLVLDL
ncbi:PDR/VanB family oxidoreductase [Caenimonas soli]|uniref:PDR/VanB family oxidoreductase n=1 Tax=Caenimonas soli TaxID=2735555 RepID=UPI00155397E3|nr:PDR/VanB family oxidoreductase [Caenimonas soli]NPC58296.1 oxidoreductase [Caenimonas soli]